jgi:ribonuclease-3
LKASNWLGRLFGRGRTEPPAPEPPENPGTKLERVLGYSFARSELLETALTHPSAAVGSDVHYERLEFLGDAVLDLAIADLLMRKFPTAKEGPLSKQRASIVNARTLALKAQAVELNEMMRVG